ncbi:MAG: sulfotransferase [Myxococcota bacterium]
MRSTSPQLPWFLRAYCRTLGAAVIRLGACPLDPSALMASAARKSGLDDFGAPSFQEGLDVLCRAARNAPLTAFGQQVLHGLAELSLINRLRLTEKKKQQPAIFRAPLLPPIIVMGLPRSGTTFLHRLLTATPGCRAVPYYRLVEVLPDARRRRDRRLRTHTFNVALRRRLLPEMDRVHYLRADSPEECMFALGMTFESLLFWVAAPLYDYLDWYLERDRTAKYETYRDLLQLWQSETPAQRLVLKAPAHTDALAALIRNVPEARVVHTHRNPATVCASSASLIYESHRLVASEMEPRRLGASCVKLLESMARRNAADRTLISADIVDVEYEELVNTPTQIVRKIQRRVGIPIRQAHERALSLELQRQPQHAHGRHEYSLADFGLASRDVRPVPPKRILGAVG